MNRSPLNGAPLGSGSTNNLVRVVITQTLELVGSVKGTLLKYVVITQDLVHESSLRATVWVTEVLESVCEQVSSLVYGVETGIPNSLVSTLEMQGSCAGTKESNNTIESVCIQESSLEYSTELQVYFSGTVEHTLIGEVVGYDLNISVAPEDRRIVCPPESRSFAVSA